MIYELNEKVEKLIKKQISDGRQIGVQVCAYQYGKKIVDTWAGTMGPGDNRPVKQDSLFCSWSTTKGVAATALHILADQGFIEYDAPVTQYWKEFGKHGKDKITVAQAMSHQAGIYKTPNLDNLENITDWSKGINYVENAVPAFPPGTKTGYHALTYGWIVGGIIEKATGRHIQDVIREEIAKPLEIAREMYVGIPDGVEDRLTTLEIWDSTQFDVPEGSPHFDAMPHEIWDIPNIMSIRRACIPGGTGHFMAHGLARMYGALANSGTIDGVRLVSSDRVRSMYRLVTDGLDIVLDMSRRKGIGFMLGGVERSVTGGRKSVFGHAGAGGSIALADPEVGLGMAVTLNKMVRELDVTKSRAADICNLIRDELGVN
jgi:CubicO group peptidase (beta-lactamase class C family)